MHSHNRRGSENVPERGEVASCSGPHNNTPMEKGLGECAVCSQPTAQRCAGCHQVNYCSRSHQRLHWSCHKATCAKLKQKNLAVQSGQGRKESNDGRKPASKDACEKHDGRGDSDSGHSKTTDKKEECGLCCKPSGFRCGGCWQVHYCSKDHQKQHRPVHKEVCRPYKVATNPELGRHLVATRPIRAGETILVSSAAVKAPSKMAVTCLGCSRFMALGLSLFHQCTSCGFPMCSRSCERNPLHVAECSVIRTRGIRQSRDAVLQWDKKWLCGLANAILTLRCLLLPKEEYERICQLQSNLHEMRNHTEMGTGAIVDFAVNFIRSDLGLIEFSVENISHIAALAITNGSSLPHPDDNIQMTALYSSDESLIEHNCLPNAMNIYCSSEDVSEITVVASREIKCEDHISVTYVDPMLGNLTRHTKIIRWFFRCKCDRCLDPTELGLYMNSLCCKKCTSIRGKMSMIVCSNPSKLDVCCNLNQINSSSSWKCEHCEYSLSGCEFLDLHFKLVFEHSSLHGLEDYERFMKKNLWPKGLLHPNHELIINSKITIIEDMANRADIVKLAQYCTYCSDLEHVCGKVQPRAFKGYFYHLMRLLFEMCKMAVGSHKVKTVKDKLQSAEEGLVLPSSYNMGSSELIKYYEMKTIIKATISILERKYRVFTNY